MREFRCALIDYALSDVNCIRATPHFTENDVKSQVSRLYSNISVVYIKMADFARALASVNQSLQCECLVNRASALNNRAVALIHLGRFDEARKVNHSDSSNNNNNNKIIVFLKMLLFYKTISLFLGLDRVNGFG
jgi:tetratricopeptide (TPR) repeat protein